MEDIDGGLHPVVDGQSLDEDEMNIQRGKQDRPPPHATFSQALSQQMFEYDKIWARTQNVPQIYKYNKHGMIRNVGKNMEWLPLYWMLLVFPD